MARATHTGRITSKSMLRGMSGRLEKGAIMTNNSKERKETPIVTGVLDYFPDAIAGVARVSFKGNQKHNPGQPLHWSRDKSTDHADCIGRHLAERDRINEESGEPHYLHIAWRALAYAQIMEEKRIAASPEELAKHVAGLLQYNFHPVPHTDPVAGFDRAMETGSSEHK